MWRWNHFFSQEAARPVHAVITLRILAEKMSCYYSTQERQRRKVKAKVSIAYSMLRFLKQRCMRNFHAGCINLSFLRVFSATRVWTGFTCCAENYEVSQFNSFSLKKIKGIPPEVDRKELEFRSFFLRHRSGCTDVFMKTMARVTYR